MKREDGPGRDKGHQRWYPRSGLIKNHDNREADKGASRSESPDEGGDQDAPNSGFRPYPPCDMIRRNENGKET